jgi:hypothetical protein
LAFYPLLTSNWSNLLFASGLELSLIIVTVNLSWNESLSTVQNQRYGGLRGAAHDDPARRCDQWQLSTFVSLKK